VACGQDELVSHECTLLKPMSAFTFFLYRVHCKLLYLWWIEHRWTLMEHR